VTAPLESWRLFFPAAAALGVAGLGAWGAQLAGAPLGLLPADHGAFMLWGVMGAGVHGFLLTAYARQNGAPLPSPRALYVSLAAQIAASLVLLARPTLPGPVTAAIVALPWALLLGWTVPIARTSLRRRWDDTTAAIPVTLVGALVGVVLHALGTASPRGLDVGVHAFLAPLALAVLDRVLPFFSAHVTPGYQGLRTPGFLGPLLALSWAAALAPLVALPAPFDRALLPVLAFARIALLLRQWVGWRPWPAARTPMIAVLHLGVAWFVAAWALELVGAPRSAALHALVVGGLGSLLLGVSMRVARGHGGLPMVLGRAGAALLALAQLAALARVWAGFGGAPLPVLVGSAVALAIAFAVWLGRFGPVAARR
jgi:uncharacterized protein involved in response to NO